MGALGVRLASLAAIVGLALAALFGLAAPAPGSTTADAELLGVPGLDSVTYGHTAAFTARITNTGSVTLKNVTFHNPIPTTEVDGQPQEAIFQSSSCDGTLSATEFSCFLTDRLRSGESLTLTIAWKTPVTGSSSDCPAEGPACMTNTAYWESGPGGPLTFAMGPVATTLLSGNDDSKAGTYALAPCTDPSSPTLATSQDVGPDNPLATSVCAPTLPVNDPLHPGLVTAIEELDHTPSDPGITQVSEICMPQPGTGCDDGNPFVFSPPARFTFVIDNGSLPEGERINKVFHDGVLVSKSKRADPRVVSIKNQKFKGITTVVVQSSTNGSWDFA
jgi:hypothetical protein